MNIEQMLQQTGAVNAISRELGVDATTAHAGAAALLPSILSGFQSPVVATEAAPAAAMGSGLGGLVGTLRTLGGGSLLDNATSPEPTEVGKGNEILGQIFGSKDTSRAVAADAASQTGVDPALLKKMLPILAMIVAGYVMKQGGANSGGLGGMLGSVFGGDTANQGGGGPSRQAGSANILEDLIGAAGTFLRR